VHVDVDAAELFGRRRNPRPNRGGIDIYVHNTSGKPAKSFEAWKNNFDIDLMSLVEGVDAAKPFLADGGGSLISIGTTAVVEHFASGSGSYSAFKAAVTNWTLGQAQVLGAKGIRCNVVQPGPIMVDGGDWDRIKGAMPDFFAATEKNLGHAARRRQCRCVPCKQRCEACERREPHGRWRVPQARRLLIGLRHV
jgi:NAD(P)-dependent dehydrogenase (short-subunit alcohol dehydrogenase family)